jgi:hypothetical protein
MRSQPRPPAQCVTQFYAESTSQKNHTEAHGRELLVPLGAARRARCASLARAVAAGRLTLDQAFAVVDGARL